MPISIVGGKYPLQTLTAVGINTVTVNGAVPFVVADFTGIQRIAALYTAPNQVAANPGFDSDTAWTKGSGVTISGGKANCINGTTLLSQNINLVVGRLYTVSIAYTMTAGAKLRLANGMADGVNQIYISPTLGASGAITATFIAAGNGITISADTAIFNGTLDNFTVTDTGDFKGIAYVRRAPSTTVLELETAFFDPVNGNTVTQVVGDTLLVSKNFAECVTAGLAVPGTVVTISDTMTIGIAGSQTSACIYDEYKSIVTTTAALALWAGVIQHAGGVFTLGHLLSWPDRTTYGGCDWNFTNPGGMGEALICTNTAAHQFLFGGARSGTAPILWEPAHGSNKVNRAGSLVWMGVDSSLGILSPNDGGPWLPGTEDRMCFLGCNATCAATGIAFRTANGVLAGGGCKIVGATSLAAFGSGHISSATTFNFGAGADDLFIVSDIRPGAYNGQPSALWDQGSGNGASTINYTNVITPLRTVIRQSGAVVTFNWYWRNAYTNLQAGTLAVIERSVDRVVAASVVAAESSADLTILEQTQAGANTATPPVIVDYSRWDFGLWKYGYGPLSGSFSRTTYDLGTAGSSNYVAFGGPQLQEVDASITASKAIALAYTSIDTLDRLYDRAMAWKCASAANAQYPTLALQLATAKGAVLDMGSLNFVVDATADTAFVVNTTTNTITIKSLALSAGSKFKSLTTTGTVTFANGGTITAPYQDSAGIRVVVTKSGGGNFNISARSGTTGAYTSLGFQSGVSTVTYTVPKGTPVEVAAWALGCISYARLIDTSAGGVALAMEMTANLAINTVLDVSAYLDNISTTLDHSGAYPVFVVTVNAAMTVPDIEVAKALVHRLVSSELALSAGFPPGSVSLLAINSDEITINQPSLRIEVGLAVTATQRVYLDAFFNRAPALAINPSWELAPVRADGNQVQILRTKPALDPGYLAAKVVAAMPVSPTLAQIEASAVLAKKADLPVAPDNAGIAAIKAKTDALVNTDLSSVMTVLDTKPTLAQIEASDVLTKKADLPAAPDNAGIAAIKAKTDALPAQPAAVGSAMTLTGAYDAAKTAAAQSSLSALSSDVVTLGNMVTGLGTPAQAAALAMLASNNQAEHDTTQAAIAALPVPATPPSAADIKVFIEASTVLAKKADLPAAPDNAGIAAIKAKTDTLTNTDTSTLATSAAVAAVAATINTVAADVADLQGLM